MSEKSPSHFFYKVFSFFLFVSLVMPLFASQGISPVSAQAAPQSAKNILGYAFRDLPVNAHAAMTEAIQSRPLGILDGGTYFVVGHYEADGIWGIGHLGAAVGSEPPIWENSIWFIVQARDPWQVALQGTPLFNELMIALPVSLKNQITPSIKNEIGAQATTFLFPWDKSQIWRYTGSWHGTLQSVDFAPSNVTPANMWILASAGGTVALVCSDTYQAAITLTTPDGAMTYRHIDYNTLIAQNVAGKTVTQGQKLSVLYNGTVGGGFFDISVYPYTPCQEGSSPSCIKVQFNTYCGSGSGPHVHWALPKFTTVDGWTIDNNGIWSQSGQANKGVGSSFTSTNPPSPSLVNSVLPTSRTVSVGTTATIFNTVINAGTIAATGVNLSINPAPAGAFVYQETNCATNAVVGLPNQSSDLAAGAVRCYVLSFTPSASFPATSVHVRAQAGNAPSTNLLTGINTWLLRATDTAGPDIIALTTTTDFHQVACSGANAFAVALSNVGAAAVGDITAVANTGAATLPLTISISETNPATGTIIGNNVLHALGAGENRTVAVFVTFNGCVNFDAAANRIFIEFRDASNNVIGSTSTAVSTGR